MQADVESLSKYKSIVKRAKESRTCKEKLLNSSNDGSFTSLQKRRKQNLGLSQSFVMRQTIALSAKNKQLANALAQSRQIASEYQLNLQKMQEKIMTVIMKLNSREVSLNNSLQELEKTKKMLHGQEEMYSHLYNQFYTVLENVPKPCERNCVNKSDDYIPVSFSIQPKRVPASKSTTKSTIPLKPDKWRPDLSIVDEKLSEDSIVDTPPSILPCIDERLSLEDDEEVEQWLQSRRSDSPTDLASSTQMENTECDDLSSLSKSQCEVTKKSDRRRSSLFSISSFDPDEALFNITDNEETKELAPSDHEDEADMIQQPETAPSSTEVILSTEVELDTERNKKKIVNSKQVRSSSKVSTRRKKNFKNTSCGDETTIFSDLSMNLTDPVESEIVVTKLATKKKFSKKEKTGKRRAKKGDAPEISKPCDKDVYNCSSDSFLFNPDKKIELSNKKLSKPRSLPMTNITNDLNIDETSGRRSRRRTAGMSISYKEPSLMKKLRQGDKFFASQS